MASPSSTKKPQPLPWTHQETKNLIQSYQDKWYSLKKGQLKSFQWEQVCLAVAARCGYNQPSKSATQCRHKIEKLRKRYRAERLKPYPDSWPYFHLMDSMETGPFPITMMARRFHGNENESDDSDLDCNLNKSRSINHIVKGSDCSNVERNVRDFGVLRKPKRKDFNEEEDDDGEEEEEGQGTRVVTELAVQIRMFAENFVKVEQKKVQMMRETAKYQMEMENKRMKMIVEAQRKIVDTIHEAFNTSHKKMKMAS
ncbi:Trihelix transcription factor ASIL2 [Heracleum sosnowskyi]|uniref:Trihelix transcription factor ASIL2 n=1 Tax=Heracleum sosnowskyi TaxID=360622 RepID=A0AAD8GPE3_9APIA|nr:Trihelix transcription factor ASIL2 [Heracleum sosnowskyi]